MKLRQATINRWQKLKEANKINAADMASVFNRYGLLYEAYENVFISTRNLLRKKPTLNIRCRVEKMHDIMCKEFLESVRFDFGTDIYKVCKQHLFTFDN